MDWIADGRGEALERQGCADSSRRNRGISRASMEEFARLITPLPPVQMRP
jgi:hypothetical protein